MDLKLIQINSENFCIMVPFGKNRSQKLLEWHQKLFKFYNIPINYLEFPFESGISHGQTLDWFLNNTISTNIDYYIFLELDSIPLKQDFLNIIYDKIRDGQTVFATSQVANHLDKNHVYAAPNFLCFSKKLYFDLDKTSLCCSENCDTAQNLTRRAQEYGKQVCLIYPSDYYDLTEEEQKLTGNPKYWDMSNVSKFGLGTTYGDLIYHNFMNSVPRSKDLFINKVKEIIENKFSYKNIEGWFDFDKIYDEAVENGQDGDLFVEIGSFLGKSSCYFAQKIKESGKKIKLYCIDTFKGVENDAAYNEYFKKYGADYFWKFKENVEKCGLNDIIFPIQSTSEEASKLFSNKSLKFIFIDANHEYDYVKKDIEVWYPKLKTFGTVGGHDYAPYAQGVIKAVDEFFGNKVIKPTEGTTWVVYHPEKKVEAIIVCLNMSDYLELTLRENRKYFDHIIVVTDENDKKTQEVVKYYNNFCENKSIECVFYDGWTKNGAKFNFGGARQFGLNFIKYNDWICFLDVDCEIKENFENKLNNINKFYGSYRRFIPSYVDYNVLNKGLEKQEKYNDVREGSGNGFIQILNYHNPIIKKYGLNNLYEDSYSATEIDIKFLKKFCPLVENDPNLVRMGIEIWHLGAADGQNNEGISEKDKFFK